MAKQTWGELFARRTPFESEYGVLNHQGTYAYGLLETKGDGSKSLRLFSGYTLFPTYEMTQRWLDEIKDYQSRSGTSLFPTHNVKPYPMPNGWEDYFSNNMKSYEVGGEKIPYYWTLYVDGIGHKCNHPPKKDRDGQREYSKYSWSHSQKVYECQYKGCDVTYDFWDLHGVS
jgi:hypothetical protein